MPESSKNDIVVFVAGAQRQFIEDVRKSIPIEDIARLCSCSTRTVRDWQREKFNMRLVSAEILSQKTHVPLPTIVSTRSQYSHTSAAGKKGATALLKKFGRIPVDPEYRNTQWEKWWDRKGKFERPAEFQPRRVHFPKKSVELAEFIGTMMGDGGMHAYQAFITLHHIDDRAYGDFIIGRIRTLFDVEPSVYHRPKYSTISITISRRSLVLKLHALGLPIGNKVRQEFDMPDWIKKNQQYAIACIRGLIDTDGSVITHSYRSKSKWYRYKKLSFCTYSKPLQFSVAQLLSHLGMRPRISGHDVRLDSISDVQTYFSLIGSHNPKHLERYRK